MKRGPKADLPSTKMVRGTFRPDRDGSRVEIIEPDSLPQMPDWLTEEGREVWMDDIGRVAGGCFASERDSMMFAQYCNLQGAIVKVWRKGEVPPAAYLTEVRRTAEQFGLFGVKSRMAAPSPKKPRNAFADI